MCSKLTGTWPISKTRLFFLHDGLNHPAYRHHSDEPARYRSHYVNQVRFLNQRLLDIFKSLQVNAQRPTVVVLQGDHGPASSFDLFRATQPDQLDCAERFGILNAILFPKDTPAQIPQDLSPVNNFRVVFNHCFGQNLPILEAHSYFCSWNRPYKFIEVTTP